ncbi:MAG: 3-dehydroquinate synthase [Parahaliea sp.]
MIDHTLQVELGERSYPIYIGRGLLSSSELLTRHIAGRQVLLISNETVAPLYAQKLKAALGSGYRLSEVILPDGEQYKTITTVEMIFDKALQDNHSRKTTVIALGGGVVGDMAGFAAACYQRGVDFIQVPTTLLSQVDSSVGGKTGVNHPLGKNMIGAFYQPKAVVIDTDTLDTLPPREFSAGLAEIIKYGLICDAAFYDWLLINTPRLLERDKAAIAEAVERSCRSKAAVVAEDEREGGVRAILNLGHTFGHAIETHQGYGNWLHGEAVAAGMVMAACLSARRGWISEPAVKQLIELLQKAELPVAPPAEMTLADFKALMARDKKVIDGRLRLVLLKKIGSAAVVDNATESELERLVGKPQDGL